MANPLAKLGRANTSKEKTAHQDSPGVSPEALKPHEESIRGIEYVNPYRGMEDHGVDPTKATPIEDLDGQWDELYDEVQDEPEPDPVAVRIVNNASEEYRAFKTIVVYATPNPQTAVIGRDAERTRVTINYTGSNIVYLAHTQFGATPQFGYPLSPDTHFSLLTDQPIYLGSESATVRANLMVEYS